MTTASRGGVLESITRRPWLCAWLIFIVALSLRSALALMLPREILWPDGYRYLRIAENLLEEHSFGTVWQNQASVPTQPLLIAAVQLVFGHSLLALRLFFATLGAATCVVGFLLARELFGVASALVAGALLAIYPYYIYLSTLFEYPQALFIFTMSLAFWLLYRFLRTDRLSTLFLAGLFLGIGVLSVPTVLAFVPVLAACLALARIPRRVLSVAVLLVATALPVGAWTVRNYAAYREFILVDQAGGNNFWQANNETYFRYGKSAVEPPCAAGNADRLYCKELTSLERALHSKGLSVAQIIKAEEATSWKAGWRFLSASPARAVRFTARKLIEFWSPVPDAVTSATGRIEAARDWASILSYIPVLLLALVGVVLLRREARRLLPVYGYLLTLTAVYAVFLPTTRYRLPLDFFLVVFAAYTVSRGAEAVARRQRRRSVVDAASSVRSTPVSSPSVIPPSR